MLSVPPLPVENLGKVWENSRAGENPWLRLGSLSNSVNVRLSFYQTMRSGKTCFIDHFHKWRLFSILFSVFKFAWLTSFGLKDSFEFFTQRRSSSGKFEYRQKNTKTAAINESGLILNSIGGNKLTTSGSISALTHTATFHILLFTTISCLKLMQFRIPIISPPPSTVVMQACF